MNDFTGMDYSELVHLYEEEYCDTHPLSPRPPEERIRRLDAIQKAKMEAFKRRRFMPDKTYKYVENRSWDRGKGDLE